MKTGLLALLTTMFLALIVTACTSNETDVQDNKLLDGPALVVFYTDN